MDAQQLAQRVQELGASNQLLTHHLQTITASNAQLTAQLRECTACCLQLMARLRSEETEAQPQPFAGMSLLPPRAPPPMAVQATGRGPGDHLVWRRL